MPPPKLKLPTVLLVLAALLVTLTVAQGGHELPVYPSYYPHEIAIETMPSERAADLLRDGKLHAYLGAEPPFSNALPPSVRAVESLSGFMVVRLNPDRSFPDERSACAVIEAIVRETAGKSGFVFHPYPVTPWHGDYFYHVDQAEAEKARLLATPTAPPRRMLVKAAGAAAGLVRPEWRAEGSDWDAAIEEVAAAGLVSALATSINGWPGPPWVKSGWFYAER